MNLTEEQIEVFYNKCIKCKLPIDLNKIKEPEMNASYDPVSNRIKYTVKIIYNPAYQFTPKYFDCGSYDMFDIIRFCDLFNSIKIREV